MSRKLILGPEGAPIEADPAPSLPSLAATFRVSARREPGTLNVLQVVVEGPDVPAFAVHALVFLPDRVDPQTLADLFVSYFEAAVATLRGLGLRVRPMQDEAPAVVQEIVVKTVERFRRGIAGPDGRIRLATLNGRPGVLPAEDVPVTESVTPAAEEPPPDAGPELRSVVV